MNDIADSILNKVWQEEIVKNNPFILPVQNPQGFVLGGQPGAGKSNLINMIGKHLNRNIIAISGDDFRKYHPQYAELQEKYGKDSVNYTANFAGKIAESILLKAINQRYNIVIEGTFRTFETPIKTLKLFKNNSYKTHILIQTCNKSISWASCNERYKKMLKINPKEARFTPKDKHDIVCKNLAKNIKEVFLSGFADSFRIYIRNDLAANNIEKFFDSALDSKLDIDKLDKIINKAKFIFTKVNINLSNNNEVLQDSKKKQNKIQNTQTKTKTKKQENKNNFSR